MGWQGQGLQIRSKIEGRHFLHLRHGKDVSGTRDLGRKDFTRSGKGG